LNLIAHNGTGLADVPALAFRLSSKLDEVDERAKAELLLVSRYIGKPLLFVRLVFF
jgi:hypothetical protein